MNILDDGALLTIGTNAVDVPTQEFWQYPVETAQLFGS